MEDFTNFFKNLIDQLKILVEIIRPFCPPEIAFFLGVCIVLFGAITIAKIIKGFIGG